MEKFEPKIPETIGKQECIRFIREIRDALADNFPFLSENDKNTFLEKLDSISENSDVFFNPDLLARQIRIVLATLENGHTVLRENKKEDEYGLENPIYYKAGKFWADIDGDTFEVTSLNDIPMAELVEEKRKEIGGGTNESQIEKALEEIIVSEKESDARLEIKKTDGKSNKIETKFSDKWKSERKNRKFVEGKMLSDNIGYLNVRSWSNGAKTKGKNIAELAEEELENITKCDSLIIDVRQNGGGNSSLAEKLAGHFTDQPIEYGIIFVRTPGTNEFVEGKCTLSPQGEFLDKKIVVLTGPRCASSNEMFIMMLKDGIKATTIGQTTSGSSGNPRSFDLNLGNKSYTLNVSTWIMTRNNGKELHNVGIEPDISVEITPDDVIKHRDVELDKAIEYLKQ